MDCSDCGLLGCGTINYCTWTPTFFKVKMSWVKNMVKLRHATKGRWSISSKKRGTGNTTQSKSIQMWMENEKNQETKWFFSLWKYQTRMTWTRMKAAYCAKMITPVCKSARHHNRWPQSQSDTKNCGYMAARRDLKFIYITLQTVPQCNSAVISNTAVSYME
jgi:hypothetical protein